MPEPGSTLRSNELIEAPAINRRPRQSVGRRGLGPVPYGCHTLTRRHRYGTRKLGPGRLGPARRARTAAATPAPWARATGPLLGPGVPESAGDHDCPPPPQGASVAGRLGRAEP